METEIVKILANYGALGAFCILAVILLVYVLKTSERREAAFQSFLIKMSECMPRLEETCKRIEEKQDTHVAMVNSSLGVLQAKLDHKA